MYGDYIEKFSIENYRNLTWVYFYRPKLKSVKVKNLLKSKVDSLHFSKAMAEGKAIDLRHFAIRIRKYEGYEDKISKMLTEEGFAVRALCVEHKGSRADSVEHFHIAIETTEDLKIPTLRARMRLLFTSGKGNSHMSLKPWDGNSDYLAYMFHEADARIVCDKGYSDVDILQFRKRNDEVKAEFQEKIDGGPMGIILQQLKTGELNSREEEIAMRYCKLRLDEGKYLPDPYQLRRVVNTILARHLGETFLDTYIQGVFRQS